MHDKDCHPDQSLGQYKLQINFIKSAWFDEYPFNVKVICLDTFPDIEFLFA